MKVRLLEYPNHPNGVVISFPWSQQDVDTIKLSLATQFNWDKKFWYSDGPEVLLDFKRFGIDIEWMDTHSRALAEEFRQQLWDVMEYRLNSYEDEMYGYQKQGSQILAAMPNSILGDDMGTGKSKQALDAAAARDAQTILILCPKTICYNWVAEVQKWHPEWTVGVVPDITGGNKHLTRKKFWANPPQVVIANYEKVKLSDWDFSTEWDIVICDEATKLKNATTGTYKDTRRVILRSRCAWALTGTPLEIRLEELYNILCILRPAVLGNYVRFRDQHMITDWTGTVVGAKNIELLRDRISPFMLRRTKAEVLKQLPPKLYQNIYVKLSPKEEAAYQAMTAQFNNWLDEHGVSGGGDPLVQTLRMRQFCATPMLFTDDLGKGSKFETLKEIIDEWQGKIVVFCFFEQVIDKLHGWLGCHPEAIISGKVTSNDGERIRRAKAFSDGQMGKVFVSTDAGGMGINITGANLIIHHDQLWNPQRMHQREDRLHRIGQTDNVTVMNLLNIDTIDYGMYQLNREREQLFEEIVDGAEEAILRKLDAPRLRRLVEGKLNESGI